jgi:retron-type reverse transcriptase
VEWSREQIEKATQFNSVGLASLRKEASAGVDGVTYGEYQQDAERNIQELYQQLKDGKYQAQPLRRVCEGGGISVVPWST